MNNEESKIPEWHNIAEVSVLRICDNSIVSCALFVKIIEKERFYKVNNEHLRLLPATEYINGFGYNAVSASYRVLV